MKKSLLSLAIISCIASGIYSPHTYSRELDGTEHTVNPGDLVDDWGLKNNAILNVMPGAVTGTITSQSSTLNMRGSESKGMILENSSASISDSVINSDGMGIVATDYFSTGGVSNLAIENTAVYGKSSDPQIIGDGTGIYFGDGNLTISKSSVVKGEFSGIVIVESGNSSTIIDGSTVEGSQEYAILIGYDTGFNNVVISNGSTLKAGNNQLIYVSQDSTGSVVVDNSHLVGDFGANNTSNSFLDIILRNNASLTGQITNSRSLNLETGGIWNLVDDASIGDLVMNGGTANLSDASGATYRTLTADTLSGSGNFMLASDIAQGLSDKLVITGNAEGDHVLHVRNTGMDPEADTPLELVKTGGGDAQFSVAGGAVDIGLWKYYLNQSGNDWKLEGTRQEAIIIVPVDPGNPEDEGADGEGGEDGQGGEGGTGPVTPPPSGMRELSNSAKTVIGLNAAVDNLWYGENSTLALRMGQVRSEEAKTGMWSRGYGRDIRAEAGQDVGYRQSLTGFQLGGDRQVFLNTQPLVLGAFAGYSNSSLRFDGSSTGRYESQYGGAYASWFSESGWYADALVKADHVTVKARPVMSDGSNAAGRYSQNIVGAQVETGKKITLGEEGFVTPFVKASALHASGYDFELDNGMKTDAGSRKSLQGSAGVKTGINHKLENGGTLSPYVRAAAVQEFAKDNKVKINGTGFDNSVEGTRGELATGVSWQVSDKVSLQAEVDYAKGKQVERNWGGNVGFEYRF